MSMVEGWDQIKYLIPEVQTAELKLRGRAQAMGITYTIADYGGLRTEDIVNQLIKWRDDSVAAGGQTYRVAPFDVTKHAVGGAFDIRIQSHPSTMTAAQAYAALGAIAPAIGLTWGGTFSAPADIYHFESPKSRDELQTIFDAWQAQGGADGGSTGSAGTVAGNLGKIGIAVFTALAVGLLVRAFGD